MRRGPVLQFRDRRNKIPGIGLRDMELAFFREMELAFFRLQNSGAFGHRFVTRTRI